MSYSNHINHISIKIYQYENELKNLEEYKTKIVWTWYFVFCLYVKVFFGHLYFSQQKHL